MSSLFGGSKPVGSLFGQSTTASTLGAGGGGSVFGSFGGAAATPPAATGANPYPFGSKTALLGTSTTPGTLFGGAPAQTQAQQQPQATGQPGLSSTFRPQSTGGFGSLLGPQPPDATTTAAAPSSTPNGPSAAPQPGGALFDALVAKAKRRAEGESVEDLPSLQLGLNDIQKTLGQLGRNRARVRFAADSKDRSVDGRAHYLLAASGVDPGAAVKDLSSLGVRAVGGGGSRTDGRPAGELDVEAYLSNLQTRTTLSMIADGLERSVRDFDSFLEDNVTMEWEAQRKRIYEHFGIKPREEGANGQGGGGGAGGGRAGEASGGFGRSKRRQSAAGTPSRGTPQRNSAFGRSSNLRSVIGAPSRIGTHASQFVDVEMVNGAGSGSGGAVGGASIADRFIGDKQKKYKDKVRQLNDNRMLGLPYPVMYEFAEVSRASGDVHAPKIVEAYEAMMEIIGEDPSADPTLPGSTARERQFANIYINTQAKSQDAVEFRRRLLAGANRFLEKQFFRELEASIAKSPLEANLGGRPDVVSKIRAHIRVLSSKKNLVPDNTELQQVGGEYVWAVVFYLLRSGHVTEAAQYVNDNQNHFRSIDRTFSGYINSYASSEDRRLKRPMQERCNNEYTQRARNAPEGSIDPFRMACYKIIGRCDVANRSLDGLKTDVNDWIWLQFNLAREGDRAAEFASESYGLAELQASIMEIGNKHFAPNGGSGSGSGGGGGGGGGSSSSGGGGGSGGDDGTGAFGMFFFLQILAGMYEAAIAYLYAYSRTDAVHFAIALEFYGLLRPADAMSVANELKSYNTRNQLQINFAPLVGLYTQDFRAADVAAAVDYIVLICLNVDDRNSEAGRQQAALCHEALRALVLETREFSKLIGDIRPDGQRIKGIIAERGLLIGLDNEDEFLRTISLEAARAAEESGRTTDAVLLNHLAGDYDAVIGLVGRTVSEAISMGLGEEMRLAPVKPRVEGSEGQAQMGTSLSLAAIDDPVELARTMLMMYERDQMYRRQIREPNRQACGILLKMSEIKGLMEGGNWAECLDKIRSINILPLNAKGDQAAIRSYAGTFAGLPQTVASNVPNLVSWTTTCCARQRERLAAGQFTGNEATARMLSSELRQITVDLTTYTSQLRYRFPPDVLEALARAAAD